jgi:hypothetical protein
MPAPPKIPPKLHDAIMAQVAEGKTSEQVCAWLKEEHGVSVSDRAVRDLIKRKASHRSELIDAATKEHLGKSLPSDLAALDKVHADLESLRLRVLDALTNESKLTLKQLTETGWLLGDLSEKQRKATETKLKLSGLVGGKAETLADFLAHAFTT